MDALDDPLAAVKRELGACPLGEACDASVVDFHAEASSEKWAFADFADGKASLIAAPIPIPQRRSSHSLRGHRFHH